jgi:predicted regulator of Ras-like GTPase activity (Roadblock/LC7/MglB family)
VEAAAERALADLTEISSQIEAAVLLDDSGTVVASTGNAGERLGAAAQALLTAAVEARSQNTRALTQLEAATLEGSVFVVREGSRTIAATTGPEPTVGLVFYDLKSALRSCAAEADAAA